MSAWSSGNSFLYISSRSLYSLAVQGSAPCIFKTCSKHGVPHYAVGVSSLFGALAYHNCGSSGSVVFNWFVNLTHTSGFISWICCCIVYLRFRKACRAQNMEVPWKSFVQPYGAYITLVMFTLPCLLNGFIVFFPRKWSASSFLTACVGLPIFVVIYLAHRVVFRHDKWVWDPEEVDMQTGLEEATDCEKPLEKRKGWKRIFMVIE